MPHCTKWIYRKPRAGDSLKIRFRAATRLLFRRNHIMKISARNQEVRVTSQAGPSGESTLELAEQTMKTSNATCPASSLPRPGQARRSALVACAEHIIDIPPHSYAICAPQRQPIQQSPTRQPSASPPVRLAEAPTTTRRNPPANDNYRGFQRCVIVGTCAVGLLILGTVAAVVAWFLTHCDKNGSTYDHCTRSQNGISGNNGMTGNG